MQYLKTPDGRDPTPGTRPGKIDGIMPDNDSRTDPSTTPPFPTYGEWLADHGDSTLVDLFWRLRAFHSPFMPSAGSGTAGSARGTAPLPTVTDVGALRQLDAAHLAVLHALVRAGATHRPVDRGELRSALTGLFDTAGTPEHRRLPAEELPGLLTSLAHLALAYGPGLRVDGAGDAETFPVAVPGNLRSLFGPATDIPWALVDGYRCPVPTRDMPDVLGKLPERQRRLLDTLSSAGGIGHSTSLDDPERPLARMIDAGLLDRIDAGTARLSPRVGAFISGRIVPAPGGDFTVAVPVPVTGAVDSAGAARAVETLRRVTDLLTDLATAPLRPLTAGGVGVRELTRVSRSTGATVGEVTGTLLLCRHADLVSRGLPVPAPEVDAAGPDGDVWGVTDRGAEFLSADTARRWALLLYGWSSSPHAQWEAATTGAHLLEDSLDSPRITALRRITAELVTVLDGGTDAAEKLWQLRPSLAARTGVDALDAVLGEAEELGLRVDGSPTGAAVALATALDADPGPGPASADPVDALTEALARVLPDPVHTLLIQADLTVLAPGLLDAPTESMLRRIADVESTGMASVWRISTGSLKRAASYGESAESVRGFLSGMAAEIPQGLDYLISDTFRDTGSVTAGTASTVLTAPDAAMMDLVLGQLTDAEADRAGLRRIAPTVAVSRSQLSVVVDALDASGARVKVEGDSGAVAHGPVLSLVPDPDPPVVTRDDVAGQLEAAVETLRRSQETRPDDPDGSGTVPGVETVREPRAIMDALRTAYDRGTRVEISYVDADGSAVREWISVVTMSPVKIVGVTESGGTSLGIRPHRISWVGVPVG